MTAATAAHLELAFLAGLALGLLVGWQVLRGYRNALRRLVEGDAKETP